MNLDQVIGYQKCIYDLQMYFAEVQKVRDLPTGLETLNNFIVPKLQEIGEKLKDFKEWDAVLAEDENTKIKNNIKNQL